MKTINYYSEPYKNAVSVERFAIGPIPDFAFHQIKYVTIYEMKEMIAKGEALPNEFQFHPADDSIMVFGEYLHDTFMPLMYLTEDQLTDIDENELADWEKNDYVLVPWDMMYKGVIE